MGAAAIFEGQSQSFARFRATQHAITDHVVELEADRARVRANVVAVWRTGSGFGQMLGTGQLRDEK